MYLRNLFLFLLIFILGGCSADFLSPNINEKKIESGKKNIVVEEKNIKKVADENLEKKPEKEEKVQEEKPGLNVLEALQGKWISVDDSNDILEFSDWERIEHYEGKIISQDPFKLFKNHPVRDGDKMDSTGMHMVVTFKEWDSKFNILMIDEHNLTMVHLFRGNILKYRR